MEFTNFSLTTEALKNITKQKVITVSYATTLYNGVYYFMAVGSLVGIVGNGISIAVLRRHNLAETSNMLVMTLCLNDLLLCFIRIINNLGVYVYYIPSVNIVLLNSIATVVTTIASPFGSILTGLSLLLTSTIALERLIAVCFPFHVSRIFTTGRVRGFIIGLYVSNFIIFCPRIFQYSLRFEYSNVYNMIVTIKSYSDFYYKNADVIEFYLDTVCGNFILCVCLGTMFISTVTISLKLVWRKFQNFSLESEEKSSEKRIRRNRIIKMLITICSITFTTYLTAEVIGIVYNNIRSDRRLAEIYISVYSLLFHVNSTINFVIYICMSVKFRFHFIQILTWLPWRLGQTCGFKVL